MADAVHIASATTDVQAFAGSGTLYGASVTAGAATTVRLRHGTTATDPVVAVIALGGAGTNTAAIPALDLPNGCFVDRDGVASELVIYTS